MAVPHLWSDTWHFREVSDEDLLSLWGEGKTNELWEGQLVQEEMTAPYHGVVANEIGRRFKTISNSSRSMRIRCNMCCLI